METKNSPKIENALEKETPPTETEEKTVEQEPGLEAATQTQRGYLEIMWDAKDELPERMQKILEEVVLGKGKFNQEEQSYFDSVRSKWWKDKFGIDFTRRRQHEKPWDIEKNALKEKPAPEKTSAAKKQRMKELSLSLKALDNGEEIKEFNNKRRRTVFYDEENELFYVLVKNRAQKVLGVGDIIADYAWGITYVPDGNMPHAVFRALAKRILINETRRDIETLHDRELAKQGISAIGSLVDEKKLEYLLRDSFPKHANTIRGIVGERASRELLTRISLNYPALGFEIERSSALEDAELKYDFKLRKKRWLRGVAITDTGMSAKDYREYKKRIGIQFTIRRAKSNSSAKEKKLSAMKEEIKKRSSVMRQSVDDIVFVNIPMPEILDHYQWWLAGDKPSGGPEQYFSQKIKKQLLLKSTEGLIKIAPETLEKIFPEEKAEQMVSP